MDKVPLTAGGSDPRVWAEASCRVVALAVFYPARRTLDEGYSAKWGRATDGATGRGWPATG